MRATDPLKFLAGSFVVYYVAAACSSQPSVVPFTGPTHDASSVADADEPVGGSRLKAMYYVGADGTKVFAGQFQDSQRGNETCAFGTSADGSTRCLPTTVGLMPTQYSDPGCSQPISGPPTSCTPKYFVSTETVDAGCGGSSAQTHIFPATGGAPYVGVVYEGTPSSCVGTETTPTGYVQIGSEVAAGSFEQLQLQTD